MEPAERIRLALQNEYGEDQQRIAETGVEIVSLLLRKNNDYGGSVCSEPGLAPEMPVLSAIQCRMSDKIARLRNLFSGAEAHVDELPGDTMRDLAGYAIIWLAQQERLLNEE